MMDLTTKVDRKNFAWFENDHSKASLTAIRLDYGELRGLQKSRKIQFLVEFKYPITAIAGRNGSGKTTLLALAACAYHNNDLGFTPFGRTKPYYTISDFFIQSSDEIPPDGVAISFQYRYNKWKGKPGGLGWHQIRKKRGGIWSPSYNRRIYRNVVYLGVERVLPHAENRTAVGKSKYFASAEPKGWEGDVRQIVSRILARPYEDFHYGYAGQGRYRLPIVSSRGQTYSGFNMGAGESALFDIFSTIFDCTQSTRENRGVLILVDEIELGLHEEAQTRLMLELKKICADKQVQVICSTHSAAIFDCLPAEGRIFLDQQASHTEVMIGVTSAFATGKLSGNPQAELDIFVEDEVAQTIVQQALPHELRSRTNIMPIGSANALMQQLAARYRYLQGGHGRDACIIFDGDEAPQKNNRLRSFLDKLEHFPDPMSKEVAKVWAKERLAYLPGNKWPENWIVTQDIEVYQPLLDEFGISRHELESFLEAAQLAGKHNEFWTLAQKLNNDLEYVRPRFCKTAMQANPAEGERICDFIRGLLG